MASITTANLRAPIEASFCYKMLSVPVPNLINSCAIEWYTMPRNGGSVLRFRRNEPLQTFKTPLGTSGYGGTPQVLVATDIDAKMNFYGTYSIVEEQVTLTHQDPILNQLTARLGIALRQTEDELIRDTLASTASSIPCTGGVNGDRPTELTLSDVMQVIKTLMSNNAYTISALIEGTNKFATQPVRNSYYAMCSTDLIDTLESVEDFEAVANYANQQNIHESEYGAIRAARYLVSSIGSVIPNSSALGQNVYNIFYTGLESYAGVKQDGYGAQFIYREPLINDPLAQNATVAVKFAGAYAITNDQWLIKQPTTLV